MKTEPRAGATRIRDTYNPVSAIAGISLMMLAGQGQAEQLCNSMAAEYNQDPHRYFALNTVAPQPANDAIIDDMTRLTGDWNGFSTDITCKGRSPETTRHSIEFDIEATIEQNWRGDLKLMAEKENQRVLKLERVYLTPELAVNRKHRLHPATSESIVRQGDDGVVVRHKYRLTNGALPPGLPGFRLPPPDRTTCLAETGLADCVPTRMVDEVKTMNWTDSTLSITLDTYVNGLFVSRQGWELNRL